MKHLKKIVLISGMASALVIGFQNCARSPFGNAGSDSQSSQSTGITIEPMQNPYALLTGEQILKSMTNVSGLTADGTAMPTSVTNEYNSRQGVFALGPDMKVVSSPMLIGLTSLAGEVCNQTIIKENKTGSTRNLFNGIDFTKTASTLAGVPNAAFDTAVRGMARNFWGRNETSEELALIQGGKAEFLAANSSATMTSLMIYTCAAMLSSVDSYSY